MLCPRCPWGGNYTPAQKGKRGSKPCHPGSKGQPCIPNPSRPGSPLCRECESACVPHGLSRVIHTAERGPGLDPHCLWRGQAATTREAIRGPAPRGWWLWAPQVLGALFSSCEPRPPAHGSAHCSLLCVSGPGSSPQPRRRLRKGPRGRCRCPTRRSPRRVTVGRGRCFV